MVCLKPFAQYRIYISYIVYIILIPTKTISVYIYIYIYIRGCIWKKNGSIPSQNLFKRTVYTAIFIV